MPKPAKERIYTYTDAEIRERATECLLPLPAEIRDRLPGMRKLMHVLSGIGIAGNQIGLTKRLFFVATQDGDVPLVNPRIVHRSLRKELGEEGCLSVPGIFGLVKRHKVVEVRAFTPDGKAVQFKARGLLARVLQHELDHLNGVIFIDRAVKFTSGNSDAILSHRRKPPR